MPDPRGISLGGDREDLEATVGVNADVRIIWLVVRATLARLKTPFEKLVGFELSREGTHLNEGFED